MLFLFFLQLPGSDISPWLTFTANSVLFPLMALFIWLDISRYKPYLPLFIAGKCIGIVSLLGWFIPFIKGTINIELYAVFMGVDIIFLSGDLLALAAILMISKDVWNLKEKPAAIDTSKYTAEGTEER